MCHRCMFFTSKKVALGYRKGFQVVSISFRIHVEFGSSCAYSSLASWIQRKQNSESFAISFQDRMLGIWQRKSWQTKPRVLMKGVKAKGVWEKLQRIAWAVQRVQQQVGLVVGRGIHKNNIQRSQVYIRAVKVVSYHFGFDIFSLW